MPCMHCEDGLEIKLHLHHQMELTTQEIPDLEEPNVVIDQTVWFGRSCCERVGNVWGKDGMWNEWSGAWRVLKNGEWGSTELRAVLWSCSSVRHCSEDLLYPIFLGWLGTCPKSMLWDYYWKGQLLQDNDVLSSTGVCEHIVSSNTCLWQNK